MAVFNYAKKEIDAKIVYYGPAISGKTTNLQFVHQHLKPDQRGKMVSLATNEDRTLFFDFLPIELESVRGFKTRFHLYTVPGQVYYGATRRAVLTGADGVVFVADSHAERMEDNLVSLKDLEDNLRYYGKKIENTPLIIQYNKRDLPDVLPLEELNQRINRLNIPHFESVAVVGKGVFDTLTMICRLVLRAIENGVEARRGVNVPDRAPAIPSVKGLRPEKGPAVPEAPPVKPAGAGKGPTVDPSPSLAFSMGKGSGQPEISEPKGLRLEKKTVQPDTPVKGPRIKKEEQPRVDPVWSGLDPERTMLLDMDEQEPKPAEPALEMPRSRTVRQEKRVTEAPEAIKDTPPPFPRPEDRKILHSPSAGTAEKRNQESAKPDTGAGIRGATSKRKMEVLSCGEPTLSQSGAVEIPLRLRVGTSEQSFPVTLNLSIKLDQIDPKIE